MSAKKNTDDILENIPEETPIVEAIEESAAPELSLEEQIAADEAEMEVTPVQVTQDGKEVIDDSDHDDIAVESGIGDSDGDAPEPQPSARSIRRARNKSDGRRVIEGDMDIALDALTPDQMRQANWTMVRVAMDRKTIIERPIAGVQPAGEGRRSPRVFVYYKDFRVAISTKDFFDANLFNNGSNGTDISEADEEERNLREFQMASKMIGSFIPFVITAAESVVDPQTGERVFAVAGSRREALHMKKERYFFGPKPRVNTNCRVKARVMMPTSRGAMIEVLGHEVFFPVKEMSSCKWVDPLYEMTPGKVLYVDISSLNVDRENKTIDMEVTGKTLDEKDAQVAFDSCQVGMRYGGTVISVDAQYARINLDCHVRAAVPITSFNGMRLRYGERVSVGVRTKNESKRTVYGTCIPLSVRPF